jgi:chemotaxis protein MotB
MRADAARRALMEAGVPKEQIAQVIGMGDTAPLIPDDPSASVNRRIAIVVLNRKSDKNVSERSGTKAEVEFINDGPPPTDARKPVLNKTGSLLEKLQQERERVDNSYDNPPNKDEVFW